MKIFLEVWSKHGPGVCIHDSGVALRNCGWGRQIAKMPKCQFLLKVALSKTESETATISLSLFEVTLLSTVSA